MCEAAHGGLSRRGGAQAGAGARVARDVTMWEQLGFAAYQLFAIAGMLLASTACDAAGFLGIRRRPPTRARAAAMALLLVAAGLVAAEGGGRQRAEPAGAARVQ